MSKVKKQHYVPQFYLKKFAYDGERLFVFDKLTQKQRTANVKDAAEEKYFYNVPPSAIPEGDESKNFDVQIIEKALGEIEGKYSRAIKELLENIEPKTRLQKLFNLSAFRGNKTITKKQKGALAFFVAIQYFRTKESRETTAELRKKFTQSVIDSFTETNFPEAARELYPIVEATKNDTKIFHLQSLFNPELINDVTHVLNKHIWVIGINETARPLYTSDHPVVKNGHIRSPFRSFEGLSSKGIEIAIPLTPKYILLLYERTFFAKFKNLDRRTVRLAEDNVTYYNSLQILQSHRQIYCSGNNFELAEWMCRENPKLCSAGKNRIQVN